MKTNISFSIFNVFPFAFLSFFLSLLFLLFIPNGAKANSSSAFSLNNAEAGLSRLYKRVAQDTNQGLPIIIQAHVALCDNSLIRCGAQGNGDDIEKNLYWTTSEGMVGWMKTQGKKQGWTEIYRFNKSPEANLKLEHRKGIQLQQEHEIQENFKSGDLLEIRVYQKQMIPSKNWEKYGLYSSLDGAKMRQSQKPVSVFLVVYGWRGKSIDVALQAYFQDIYQNKPRMITLPNGQKLQAGGAAHVVAWVGHNRLMDLKPVDFSQFDTEKKGLPKGFVMMACHSASYLATQVSSAQRVPLLLTKDFVFASAPALEGLLRAFAQAEDLHQIWLEGAAGYAAGEEKSVSLAKKVITNPADPTWHW